MKHWEGEIEGLVGGCVGRGRGYLLIWTIGMCRCEGYGFQAVYSRIEYINHSLSV